ncbi:MAG: aminotransferase [Myxococcales bacterium]|nr:aminotransferase [Myxococcales bacterium]MDH5307140.1 aminotransferase [Myxococcales bacterium]MDH5566567.1 aminotransferase [Myxococcales bacterium]
MSRPNPGAFERYDTKEIWRKDKNHYIHPWHDFESPEGGCLVIAESDGAYVFDADGKRYLDGIGGMWCVNVGYANEEMVQAIADQARRLAYYSPFVDTTTPPGAELAAKLADLAPGSLNRVFFSTGGSTANDTAVRLIHYYNHRRGKPEKAHIICLDEAYHGSTFLAMSLDGKADDRSAFCYIDDIVHRVSCPNRYRRPEGTTLEEFCDLLIAELEAKILEVGPERVACFFAEPIQGAGGVNVPPPGYHKRAFDVCRKYDVLYVSDEVVTAFGRLGHYFASREVFGITPDVITCAKGLTSGYAPLGATLISEEMYEVVSVPDLASPLSHGFTYSGHPVSCAAALKSIEILGRDGILENVREVGPYFEKKLAGLLELPLVGDVRGSHFMMCVENVADKATKEMLPNEVNVGKRISDACEARGLLVRPIGHLNILSPPLILDRDQIDFCVDVLRESILETADCLVREGFWRG